MIPTNTFSQFNNYIPSKFSQTQIVKHHPPQNKEEKKGLKAAKNELFFALGIMAATASASALLIKRPQKIKNIIKYTSPENDTIIPTVVKNIEATSLGKKYLNSKESIFNFINKIDEPATNVKEFLLAITADKDKGFDFIKEITQDPRKSKNIVNTLIQKVGGKNNFTDWYYHPKGYAKAYSQFIGRFYNKSDSLDNLTKFTPSWSLYGVREKFGTLGSLPKEFGSKEKYQELIDLLRKNQSANSDFEYENLKIKYMNKGYSAKTVAKVSSEDKNYIVKFQQYLPSDEQSQEMYQMRSAADSIFTNAKVDSYLTQNNCKNSVKFYYYDPKTESSVYDFIKTTPSHEQINPMEANNYMPDMNALGVYMNDINLGNFSEDMTKVIDIGHASFKDILRPVFSERANNIPNASGFDFAEDMYAKQLREATK